MPDLETLSATNRSIWQPVSYMNPVDTYVGNKGKLSALKATQQEFDKADTQTSALKDVHAKARSLAGDNIYVKNYIDSHTQQLDEITSKQDPYEIQRGVKKLANQYVRDINDDNTKLGVAVKNDAIYAQNLEKAKNDDDLLLVKEQEALYNKADKEGKTGADKYYDPLRQSYKKASLAPFDSIETKSFGQLFNDTLDKWTTDKTATASFGIEARKGSDGKYMITRSGTNEFVNPQQARQAATIAYDTNPQVQAQVKRQATVDAIKTYGLGNTDNPEVQQWIKNRETQLGKEFQDQFYNKLQFNKEEKDVKGTADPYSLMELKSKSVAEILNKPLEKPNIGGGVYKNDNLQFSKDDNLESQKYIKNNKAFVDNNGKVYSPEEINKLAKENNISQGIVERYMSDRYFSGYDEKSKPKMEDDIQSEMFLNKLGIKLKTFTEEDKYKLDVKTKQFDYATLKEMNPVLIESVKDLPNEEQQKVLDNYIIKNKKTFDNFRKDYLSALEQKGTRTSQASDKARAELSYPENIIPDELNTSIAFADNRGNNAINKNKAPIDFLKDAGVELDKGDKYKFDLVGTNLTHPNLAGGKEYKVTVNKKDGEQKIFTVLTEPSSQQKKNLQPIRILNETFSSGYPSKSYFVLSNTGQLEKLDTDGKINKAKSEGKLITLQPKFIKGENENTINGYVTFQGKQSMTLEEFNAEYEKAVAPKSEQTLEYNINSKNVKDYQLLNDLDSNSYGEESE